MQIDSSSSHIITILYMWVSCVWEAVKYGLYQTLWQQLLYTFSWPMAFILYYQEKMFWEYAYWKNLRGGIESVTSNKIVTKILYQMAFRKEHLQKPSLPSPVIEHLEENGET